MAKKVKEEKPKEVKDPVVEPKGGDTKPPPKFP